MRAAAERTGRERDGARPPASDAPQDDPRTVAAPARPLDDHVLRTLQLDLLGRPPFAAERAAWLGRGFQERVDALLGSEAFWRHWLEEQLYYFLLIDNFRPTTETVEAIPGELAAGRLDVRAALHRIALSPTFDQRNPGADTFVTVVMEQFCGLTVQDRARELESGKRIYDGGQGRFLGEFGGSQADIVRIAIESKEAARTFADREHRRHVGTGLERRALAVWTRTLHREPDRYLELLREALLSEAYVARFDRRVLQPNRMFVKTLYVDLLDRLPTPEEAEPLREALDGLSDSAPLRSIVARMLLDSGRVELPVLGAVPDRGAWIEDLFRRLLGRAPTADERAAFLAASADPACRAETVVYALVSHPEYHLY